MTDSMQVKKEVSKALGVPYYLNVAGDEGKKVESLNIYRRMNKHIDNKKFYYEKLLPLKIALEKNNADGLHFASIEKI